MADGFLTFFKFNDPGIASAMTERLSQNRISYELENDRVIFDPSFANNAIDPLICLKLRPDDFARAHQILEGYYRTLLDTVDKDYYLFDFTDPELLEILGKPDEWGHFDYALAGKILKDRGIDISPELAETLKAQRIKELSKPEAEDSSRIWAGYISAAMGGVFGLVIGWILAYFKKTIPNGQRVFVYREQERKHGKRILLISAISLPCWILLGRWWLHA
jgi:hypothetical protein